MDFSVNDAISVVIIKVAIVKDPLKHFVVNVSYIVIATNSRDTREDILQKFHIDKFISNSIYLVFICPVNVITAIPHWVGEFAGELVAIAFIRCDPGKIYEQFHSSQSRFEMIL